MVVWPPFCVNLSAGKSNCPVYGLIKTSFLGRRYRPRVPAQPATQVMGAIMSQLGIHCSLDLRHHGCWNFTNSILYCMDRLSLIHALKSLPTKTLGPHTPVRQIQILRLLMISSFLKTQLTGFDTTAFKTLREPSSFDYQIMPYFCNIQRLRLDIHSLDGTCIPGGAGQSTRYPVRTAISDPVRCLLS